MIMIFREHDCFELNNFEPLIYRKIDEFETPLADDPILKTDITLLFIETRDIPESGSIFPFSPVNRNRVKSSLKIVFRF